jgi:hypothetical protein
MRVMRRRSALEIAAGRCAVACAIRVRSVHRGDRPGEVPDAHRCILTRNCGETERLQRSVEQFGTPGATDNIGIQLQ